MTEVNKVKLRISQICPLTGKGIGWVIVSLADSAEIADLESLYKGRLSLGIPKSDACYQRDARMQGLKWHTDITDLTDSFNVSQKSQIAQKCLCLAEK